jgi:endonuclease-8
VPEGDTIFRAAATLHLALAGKTVTRFESIFPHLSRIDEDAPLAGRTIEEVTAAGKHLLMTFSGDLHLRTHMRMNGTWHIYRPGERWRRRRADMRIVVETREYVAVAFTVPVAEFHDSRSLARQNDIRRIGPDFLGKTFDAQEAFTRIRSRPNDEIANVILNQRVVAGIGNVFKSELLFVAHINPFTLTRDVPDAKLIELLEASRRIMVVNVEKRGGARETRSSLNRRARQWVYGRLGGNCYTCSTPVRYAKQGPDARSTYWCPRCQPGPDGPRSSLAG